jgi:glutathione peroxidase
MKQLCAAGLLMLLCGGAYAEEPACRQSVLDVEARRLLGGTESLCDTYAGKAVLVVNTASQCGFTGQFKGLQALYERYREQGLVVLGFPSGDFAGQEFGDEAAIAEFCEINYGVSFPMFAKVSVKGDEAHPLFSGLIEASGQAPGWNFHKYLLDRDGQVVANYNSRVTPEDRKLRSDIERVLKAGG